MNVIGTAGHIDHGKSTLVERLTGINPDKLEEERLRGMTIDLGFASLVLPSGKVASVVDVPGHERFVKNMLAGASGIDVALLVVAADEGVMPQTREHLAILDLLAVDRAVVALTKIDLVEPEWIDLVLADVGDVLRGSGLEGSSVIPVSAKTGEGIDRLTEELDRLILPASNKNEGGLAFLPIDRVFSISGFGTVATGTLHGGWLTRDGEVMISPSGLRARIRGLQTHDQAVAEAGPGSRVAVNLANVAREAIRRGDVLSHPGDVRTTTRLDVDIRVVSDAPFPLRSGTNVMLHVGAAERPAVLTVLGAAALAAGKTGFARLRLHDAVGVVRGMRFIIRVPGPGRTLGGGTVLDTSPGGRRRRSNWKTRLEDLGSTDIARVVAALLAPDRPLSTLELASLAGLPEAPVQRALEGLVRGGSAVQLGTVWAGLQAWNHWIDRCRAELSRFHTRYPLREGMPAEELRSKLRLPREAFSEALRRMTMEGTLEMRGNVVALPSHRGGTASRAEEADRVLKVLSETPFTPPSGQELLGAARTDADFLGALAHEGRIVSVAPGLFFTSQSYNEMKTRVLRLTMDGRHTTVAEVRDELQTSRKYAMALLEHLDSEQVTRRQGDVRVRGSKAPACA